MTDQTLQTATFANGCFWCTEAVFQKLKGVQKVTSGFTGGHIRNPAYREVIQGNTGHAEAIQIEFDPKKTSYLELLHVFFATHDPTTLNRQGNDVGTQYRSAIFYHSPEQEQIAAQLIEELDTSHFNRNIVTEIIEASEFFQAESTHQNFYLTHRQFPYCKMIIDPKIKKLQTHFSEKLQREPENL